MTPSSFDVAIVGAGPAGSASAISLALRGYDVALIDKQIFPREKLCGDFINPINWPMFHELGVAERILAQPHTRVSGFRITAPSGASAETYFSQSSPGRIFGLGVIRARLDSVLLQRAAEAGATVRTGTRLKRILKIGQGWRLETSAGESWRAKILVGADGRNSWVAQQLGLNSRAPLSGRSVGFQLRLKRASAESRIEIHLFPGGYAGLVNVGEGMATLGLAIEKRKLPRGGVKEFLLGERLARNPFLKTILERCETTDELHSAYPVYFSKRRAVGDGVVLVGDTARVTEPVTGEGVYFALRSGILAAETLDRALCAGDLSANYLRRYEQRCARQLRSRVVLNALLRFAIYRSRLLAPLIHGSARNNRFLGALVDAVCLA